MIELTNILRVIALIVFFIHFITGFKNNKLGKLAYLLCKFIIIMFVYMVINS
jgi:hypothetical protein